MVNKRYDAKHHSPRASAVNDCMLEHDLSERVAEIISKGRDWRTSVDRGDILRQHLLTKFANPEPASAQARHDRAIAKLLDQERINRESNLRIASKSDVNIAGVTIQSILWTARSEVSRILGDLDPQEWLGYCEFSSGASTTRKRVCSQSAAKFDNRSSASWRVWEILTGDSTEVQFPYEEFPNGFLYEYGEQMFETLVYHNNNSIFTVPKNNEINRCAAKEPDWNMFLQKGLGGIIRDRLLKAGINLNDQSINRRLAHEGSVTGKLATVDLSAASDSITTSLVKVLMPQDWLTALFSTRSEFGLLDGNLHKWELFSTMGNGFTFELESLIFYALLRAVKYHFGIKGKASVYGDDIICPVEAVMPLMSVFAFCGFRVNSDKSFFEGPYRESCGGHYVHGIDVTPIYIRGPVNDVPSLINLINQFRRWACVDGYGDEYNFQLWKELCLLLPKRVRPIVMGGNDVFQSSYVACKRKFQGGVFRVSRDIPFKGLDAVAAYKSWLWSETVTSFSIGQDGCLDPSKAFYRARGNTTYSVGEIRPVYTGFQTFANKTVEPRNVADQFVLRKSWNCETDLELKPRVIRNDGWEYQHSSSNCGEFLFLDEIKPSET